MSDTPAQATFQGCLVVRLLRVTVGQCDAITVAPFRAAVFNHWPNRPRFWFAESFDGKGTTSVTRVAASEEIPGSTAIGTSPELATRRERRMIICSWLSITTTVFVFSVISLVWPSPKRWPAVKPLLESSPLLGDMLVAESPHFECAAFGKS
jgi:hypothetical protein